MSTLRENVKPIFIGNVLLIVCSIFYLIWWSVSFRPKGHAPFWLSGGLFLLTFAFGIVGVYWVAKAMMESSVKREFISTNIVMFGAIISFVVLFLFTSYALHRQLTTELFLILGWGTLALFEINKLFAFDQLTKSKAFLLCFLIVLGIIVSLLCYILYYHLSARMAYFDGMIPLLVIGFVMLAITVSIKD